MSWLGWFLLSFDRKNLLRTVFLCVQVLRFLCEGVGGWSHRKTVEGVCYSVLLDSWRIPLLNIEDGFSRMKTEILLEEGKDGPPGNSASWSFLWFPSVLLRIYSWLW